MNINLLSNEVKASAAELVDLCVASALFGHFSGRWKAVVNDSKGKAYYTLNIGPAYGMQRCQSAVVLLKFNNAQSAAQACDTCNSKLGTLAFTRRTTRTRRSAIAKVSIQSTSHEVSSHRSE